MADTRRSVLLFVLLTATMVGGENVRTCERIEIDFCKGIGYNYTAMPNLFNHEIQEEARQNYLTFGPLIKYGCSSQLVFFLCSVYVPMCNEQVPNPIGPCRPLCESVRASCEPTLADFNFPWPEQLNCSRFPKENTEAEMCMQGPAPVTESTTMTSISGGAGRGASGSSGASSSSSSSTRKSSRRNNSSFRTKGTNMYKPYANQCSKYRYGDRVYVFMNTSQRCGQLCERDVLFSNESKHFAEIWMALWSVACFMTSAFTVLLYVIDTSQFESPDRAVVYLCLCYCLQSIGYFIRLLVGRSAASCYREGQTSVLVHQGLVNNYCSAVFVFIYYFNSAATMWWVVVTVTWFMCRPLRYTAEQVRRKMGALHCAAWLLPALITVVIVAMQAIDAEELTGVCLVGNQNRDTLLAFVVLPQIACLCVGFGFLICGAVKLYRHRKEAQYLETTSTSRTWIFALLYVIPACCVLGVNIYEYVNRDSWTLNQNGPISRPFVEYFGFKMFMSVVIGITAGLWTWCSKSPKLQEATAKPAGAPPLLVSTPFQHAPIMVQNQYYVPQHYIQRIQQQQQQIQHTMV